MRKKIFYYDTDAGGVVYHANYLKYLEEARTEFLESKGIVVHTSGSKGFLYAVRECNLLYKRPARYGDTISCDVTFIKMTAVQLFFKQKIYNEATGQILVDARITIVSLNKNFKPTPVPKKIKRLLEMKDLNSSIKNKQLPVDWNIK